MLSPIPFARRQERCPCLRAGFWHEEARVISRRLLRGRVCFPDRSTDARVCRTQKPYVIFSLFKTFQFLSV